MTSEEIASFLAVVKAGTISGAADSLFITQPALTHRITSLEKELGYSLFVRKPGIRKAELTPKGEIFVPIAEQYVSLTNKAYDLRSADTPERFSIAAIESISSLVMAPVCRKLMEQFPGLRLRIKIQYSVQTYEDMMNRSVDMGIINNTQYSRDLHCRPAFREDMFFVCQRGAGYEDIVNPKDLDGRDSVFVPWSAEYETWYQYWFYGDNGYSIYLQNVYILKDCLKAGRKWSIVPASVGNWLGSYEEFELHTIENGPESRANYLLTHRDNVSPYTGVAYELLRGELQQQHGISIIS